MTIEELAQYRLPMFSDRGSVSDALAYAYSMGDPAVTTAVHVLLNTIIRQLTQGHESVVE